MWRAVVVEGNFWKLNAHCRALVSVPDGLVTDHQASHGGERIFYFSFHAFTIQKLVSCRWCAAGLGQDENDPNEASCFTRHANHAAHGSWWRPERANRGRDHRTTTTTTSWPVISDFQELTNERQTPSETATDGFLFLYPMLSIDSRRRQLTRAKSIFGCRPPDFVREEQASNADKV
jgi:hypothetical protein